MIVSGTGTLSPGLSPGTLNLVGNYTQQGPGGAFNVEIGGTAPGSQFDSVNVSGAGSVATLAGVLNVSLVNSFVPAAGDSFTIMTYPSHTGTYTLNLPTVPCLGWKATYGATALVLTAYPLPTEVTGLAFPVTKVDLAWDSGVTGPTRTWDVLKGDLRQLPVGTGPNESCLAQAISGTTASDTGNARSQPRILVRRARTGRRLRDRNLRQHERRFGENECGLSVRALARGCGRAAPGGKAAAQGRPCPPARLGVQWRLRRPSGRPERTPACAFRSSLSRPPSRPS